VKFKLYVFYEPEKLQPKLDTYAIPCEGTTTKISRKNNKELN